MPVLDGPAMAAAVRAHDEGMELIPIILSSGYCDLAAVADRVGTPYRIPKPASLSGLRNMVALALSERHAPRRDEDGRAEATELHP
jgi:FixJ family two-component response regulator